MAAKTTTLNPTVNSNPAAMLISRPELTAVVPMAIAEAVGDTDVCGGPSAVVRVADIAVDDRVVAGVMLDGAGGAVLLSGGDPVVTVVFAVGLGSVAGAGSSDVVSPVPGPPVGSVVAEGGGSVVTTLVVTTGAGGCDGGNDVTAGGRSVTVGAAVSVARSVGDGESVGVDESVTVAGAAA